VQLPADAIVAPLRLTWFVPSAAVIVPPPHVPLKPPVAIVSPAGSVSVNATPLSATLFVLLTVYLSADVLPTVIDDGVNVVASEGATATTSDADAVRPLPLSVELTVPVVLLSVPTCEPTTSTWTVHTLPAASVPPLIVTDDPPAVAVTVALGQL